MCAIYQENLYEIIMHRYHTPDILNSMFPTIRDQCWRCCTAVGSLMHIFWECPLISDFWSQVNALLVLVTGREILLDPITHLLGLPVKNLPRVVSSLILHIFTAAQCLISSFWKRTVALSITDLYTMVKDVRLMEYARL